MIKWIEKNWLHCAVGLIIAILVVGQMDSCVSKIQYKRQIKTLNKSISEKEKDIKASEDRVDDLWKKVRASDDRIAKWDEAIKKKDEEIVVIRKERDSWKGKVEEMTPSEVVVETRKVLNCANIFERLDGVLFSLECARVNLRALRTGEFSLAMEEVEKLNDKITEMTAKDLMKDNQIKDLGSVILLKDKQIIGLKGVIVDWKEAFDLSEKRGKKMRKKGRKEGSIIGGIIGGLIGFFLGK